MSDYLSTKEVAAILNVSPQYVSNLCANGKIGGAEKNGHTWEIPKDFQRAYWTQQIKLGKKKFTFIDLFAGIGGFHQAMSSLGGKCIMASEIDEACVNTYKANYHTKDIRGDIKKIEAESIPPFDVLCAGFPCQPFSKAGLQKGFDDENRGDLFFNIIRILDKHPEVKFIILENVRNLADKEEYWKRIREELTSKNFFITDKPIILSPSNFGTPQIRERVYILGIRKDLRDTRILTNEYIHVQDLGLEDIVGVNKCEMGDAFNILEENVPEQYIIPRQQEEMIFAWDEFRRATRIGLIGFPIWLNSFGYGIDNNQEFRIGQNYDSMPDWKKRYVDCNRELYLNNRDFIDGWIQRNDMLNRIKLYQKFEWNCGNDVEDIRDTIIQIRQSGIRVKRPTYFPALVAMVNTPIIYDRNMGHFRHITPREAANLQDFNRRFTFMGTEKQIYKQLGNSVNVKILKVLGKKLFSFSKFDWNGEEK